MSESFGHQILPTPKKRASYRPAALRTNSSQRLRHDALGSPRTTKAENRVSSAGGVNRTESTFSRGMSNHGTTTTTTTTTSGSRESMEVTRDHWVPDSQATTCEVCPTTFTFLERKHHCRRCGGIFCSAHSKYTVTLDRRAQFSPTGTALKSCPSCRRDFELWMSPPNVLDSGSKSTDTVRPQKVGTADGRGGGSGGHARGAELDAEEARGLPAASVPTDWTWSTF